jgi:hypothetical protein
METLVCEVCDRIKPVAGGCQVGVGECDICADCMNDWRALSAACSHVWEIYSGELGQGIACANCSLVKPIEAGHG